MSSTDDESRDQPSDEQSSSERPQAPYGQPSAEERPQAPYGEPHGQPPYGQPSHDQAPYGQPSYGQAPHGQAPPDQGGYGTAPYGQNPYDSAGQQPSTPYGGGQPAYGVPGGGGPQNHSSATTALVLGLVGLAGIVFCGGITLLLSPFAWVIGGRAVNEIDAEPGRYGGRDQAQAGRIMGIVGTILLVLAVLALIAFIALVVIAGTTASTGTSFVIPPLG